jgi:potassium efflux system protein
MRHANLLRRTLIGTVAAWCLFGAWAAAQPPAESASTGAVSEIQAGDIEAVRQQVTSLTGIDDVQRAALLGQLDEALQQVQLADEWRVKKDQFEQWRNNTPKEVAKLEEALSKPLGEPERQISDDTPLADLELQLSAADSTYKNIQIHFDDLMREPGRRSDRRRELPTLIAAAKQRLQESQTQLASLPPGGESTDPAAARRLAEQARIQALTQEIAAYETEAQSYDVRNSMLGLRQEEAKRRLSQAEKTYKTLQEATAARRRAEAAQAVSEARQVLQEITKADPAIRDRAMQLAEANATLAEERNRQDGLTDNIESATADLAAVQTQLKQIQEDYDRVIQRVKTGGLSGAVGVLLREQRAQLPNLRELEENTRNGRNEITRIELAQNDLRERRLKLSDTEQELLEAIRVLPAAYTDHERNTIKTVVTELLQNQRALIDALQRDYDAYLNILIDLSSRQQQLIVLTGQFAVYINENVLWIGGSAVGLNTFHDVVGAFVWLAAPRVWLTLPGVWAQSAERRAAPYAAVTLLLLAGLLVRRRSRHKVEHLGQETRKLLNTHFGQSLEALALTLLLGAIWPACVAAVGWALVSVDDAAEQVHAAGNGLLAVAALLLFMETVRQILRPNGLAESHFGWPGERVHAVRRALTVLGTAAAPLVFLVFTFENQSEDAWKDAAGRVAFAAAMFLLAVLLRYVLRQALLGMQETRRSGWFTENRAMRFLVKALAVGLPSALAIMALYGFYFTALHLVYRLFWTLVLSLAVAVGAGMIRRWLLLTKRRLAIQQAQRRREAAKAESQKADSPMASPDVPLPGEDLDLVKIDTQTQSLLRIAAVLTIVFGSWFIWADVVPALNMLETIHLWPTTVDVQQEIKNDKGEIEVVVTQKPGWITASNLGLSLLVVFLTIVAVRNLPGLVEILLLQRLQMGAGERYATLAVTRYLLTGLGIILAFGTIGVGWSKVQWLVAALGVGLGFGLQEIFANFVSGLILLFERPIRVGDIVTIGEVSGTVTQIRIRATSIVNWDRKELVVPNKEFVTGQLINWTRSDPVLRVCVPVGIAYGSDTDLAVATLLKVAREHPHAMEDPEPQAIFLGFGDSALNFELRAFSPSVDYVLRLKHDLHMNVNRALREAGIEIAFPQRDLHIRSGFEPIIQALRPPGADPSTDQNGHA